jgi:hypothetical protein
MRGSSFPPDPSAGIFSSHPEAPKLSLLAAPATAGGFNTIRPSLAVVACALLPSRHFEFDSSFVHRDVAKGLRRLAALMKAHSGSPLSIFGHADPVGKEVYNKHLSGRRALAIYGLLVHDTQIWEDLYSNPFGHDVWGNRAIQSILSAIGPDPGRVDGIMDEGATEAVKKFQSNHGLKNDGIAGPKTREKLFSAYMDLLYGKRFKKLDKTTDFLARNADKGGRGDAQGCGEFNPIVMFSNAENARFERDTDKTNRNNANEPNRRVLVFLFQPGAKVTPTQWPCPAAKDGVAGCKKRFFSDAAKRRACQENHRKYEETHDTFACRFYDRMAFNSPCEREQVAPVLRIRLFDRDRQPLGGAPFRVITPTKAIPGFSEPNGDAVVRNVPVPSTCTVKWSRPAEATGGTPIDPSLDSAQFEFELSVFVDLADEEEDHTDSQGAETETDTGMSNESARRRLSNLGYRAESLTDNIKAFQRDCGNSNPTGDLKDVAERLREQHDDLVAPPKLV